jgi:hypothetical protein
VTGAGSDIRTNNAPAAGSDDDGTDDDVPDAGNPSPSLSKYLLEDNGFTVHSFNISHAMHALVAWNGTIVYKETLPLLPKFQAAPAPLPAFPPNADLGAVCTSATADAVALRNLCLRWLKGSR